MIERHPRVFHAPGLPKELHYFDRFWQDEFTQHDARAYAEFFPRPAGGFSGEWTPRYIHDFWTLALLRAAAPETKLIVLLRDPVERYLSGLAHEATRGVGTSPQVAGESWQRGFYHRQLQRLYDAFPARQILVLQFERCLAQPESELQRTYRFLGLDDEGFLPDLLTQPVNASTTPKPHMPEHVRRELAATYQADVRMLEADGHIDSSLWPNFGSQGLRDG